MAKFAQRQPWLLDLLSRRYCVSDPILRSVVFNTEFPNPLGVAAGFDKNGQIVDALAALGFGFVEVGSVSNLPSQGNPKPRMFRLPADEGLINRMGLNNLGPDQLLFSLSKQRLTIPFAVNIVKTNNPELLGDEAIADIVSCFSQVGSAGSFVVLNLSCPNTEDGRTFEEPGALWLLLHALISEKQRLGLDIPVLVKFSPDMDDSNFEQNLEICEKLDVAGYVLTNTSKSREGLSTSSSLLEKYGRGGLSGRPIFNRSLHRVATAYRYVSKDRPIIGCGGIFSGADAYQMIRAGASLLELYTAFVYIGPLLCRTVLNELAMLLRRDGFGSITEAVGVDAS